MRQYFAYMFLMGLVGLLGAIAENCKPLPPSPAPSACEDYGSISFREGSEISRELCGGILYGAALNGECYCALEPERGGR